jgi:hypothetical protein
MMKYLLLAYRDEEQWKSMSAKEHMAFDAACQASEKDLIRGLHLIDVYEVQHNGALTVRIVDGGRFISEGPADKSQDGLIQLLIIQARDLNAAIQIASQIPQARGGPIEVRPILE